MKLVAENSLNFAPCGPNYDLTDRCAACGGLMYTVLKFLLHKSFNKAALGYSEDSLQLTAQELSSEYTKSAFNTFKVVSHLLYA